MTGGDDQKFKIFDLSGKVCGIVNCETFKSTLWKMPEVNIKRRLKQIDFVLYILNLIDGVSLSESEQAAVKSRMLMERYMDETDKQLFLQHIKSLRHSRQSSGITSAVLTPARISEALLHQNPTVATSLFSLRRTTIEPYSISRNDCSAWIKKSLPIVWNVDSQHQCSRLAHFQRSESLPNPSKFEV
jgi:hypothetical protein